MKKGFTLIELLAVIVILAIIALIATPIILGIINDAKKESDKRSIELYGKAIENYVAKSQLDGTEIPSGNLDSTFLSKVQYDGSRVECETVTLNTDGTVHLSGCTVGGKEVDYVYGKEQENSGENSSDDGQEELVQNFEPQYYIWDSGTVGVTDAPASPSSQPPSGKTVYLGYDVDNGKISTVYACFFKNSNEYCLKGYDTNVYSDNSNIMNIAYEGTNACTTTYEYSCVDDYFTVQVRPNGYIHVGDISSRENCYVKDDSSFECMEK